jgi:hypothetical protein
VALGLAASCIRGRGDRVADAGGAFGEVVGLVGRGVAQIIGAAHDAVEDS